MSHPGRVPKPIPVAVGRKWVTNFDGRRVDQAMDQDPALAVRVIL